MRILVFGANTDVGKTLCSLGLCAAGTRRGPTSYLKPVETGVGDASRIRQYLGRDLRACDALYSYERPVSPHLAATNPPRALRQDILDWLKPHLCIIETAGGPLSPAPDRSLQADVYASMDARCVLVGDAKLGGISATLCAKESLEHRGIDVDAVCFVDDADDVGTVEYLRACAPVFTVPRPPDMGPLHDWLGHSGSAFDRLLDHLLR